MSLDEIFKAYDIRGVYPDQIDESLARRIGNSFAHFTGAQHLVVGYDMRPSSVPLATAFIEGATLAGADVTDVGLASTDLVYFASGHLDAPGAMLTASHNPAKYNGIKLCRAGAAPVGEQTGLQQIKDMVESGVTSRGEVAGKVEHVDMLQAFGDHVRSFVDTSALKPMKVVADTANGMGGLVVPAVFEGLPFSLTVLYGELDGTFPNHPADPIQLENLKDLQRAVLDLNADVGLAFDGDADRVFLVDDKGVPVSGSTTTAIVAAGILDRHPGETIVLQPHLLAGRTRDHPRARRHPGAHPRRPLVHQAGHGRDRRHLRRRALRALLLPRQLPRRLRFDRVAARARAARSGRHPAVGAAQAVRALRAERRDQLPRRRSARGSSRRLPPSSPNEQQDRLDGLTVDCGDWWFNLRPSNTEPLLRLNLEAADVRAVRRAHP